MMARMLLLLMAAVVPAEPEQHPVQPLLDMTQQRLVEFNRDVHTYQCVVHRKERVRGVLRTQQAVFLRVRQQPFAVYLKVLSPPSLAGREALYNPGVYGEQVIARNGGQRFAFVTTAVGVDSDLIKAETNYRVHEWGVAQTLATVIRILQQEKQYPDVQVEHFKGAKVDGRGAFGARITHPTQRQGMQFCQALVLIDDEIRLPVYYQAIGWPQNDRSQLLEEFSFTKWQFNVSLSAQHFSHKYGGYGFNARKEFPYANPGAVRRGR
jgi:hypothetical protein